VPEALAWHFAHQRALFPFELARQEPTPGHFQAPCPLLAAVDTHPCVAFLPPALGGPKAVFPEPFSATVKGGEKVRRVADQNCGTWSWACGRRTSPAVSRPSSSNPEPGTEYYGSFPPLHSPDHQVPRLLPLDAPDLPLGQRILTYRHTRGLRQEDLARQLGVGPSPLAAWEKDSHEPGASTRMTSGRPTSPLAAGRCPGVSLASTAQTVTMATKSLIVQSSFSQG
jgi:hypothetical protein